MTVGPGSGPLDGSDGGPTTVCRICQVDVPAGEFCGLCGVGLNEHRGGGPDWLRLRQFGAAPGEHLLKLALVTSLFPHLTPRSLTTFRLGMFLVLAALVASAMLRVPACLITVAALGVPLLFVLYLFESDAQRDLPLNTVALAAVLGVGLGIGWALLTGAMVAHVYNVPLGGGVAAARVLRAGVGVSVGGALLLFVPALVVRLAQPSTRESLDGFMIGALGALALTAGATLTRLLPQLTLGLVNRSRPMSGLLTEAGIRGIAVPVTAAAAGGLFGAALWFIRPASKARDHPTAVRSVLAIFGIGIAVLYAILGLIDTMMLSQWLQLACHLVVAAVAVLLLRIGLHLALLHEVHDDVQSDQVLLCSHCGHVVPDMPFCAACGVATRAASRSSRRFRRDSRPVRIDDGDGDHEDGQNPMTVVDDVRSGHAAPANFYRVQPLRPTPLWRLISAWGIAVALIAGAKVGLSAMLSEPAPQFICPPNCGRPATGPPVAVNPTYTAEDGSFSVSYPAADSAYNVTRDSHGVTADLTVGDRGTLRLFSEPASGRTPKEIADAIVGTTFPDTSTAYEIPNAMVGYQPGYGVAVDGWPQGANSDFTRVRILVVVAVKNDLALVAGAVGPYRQFGPDVGPGMPSGANLEIAEDMGKYVNSFSWRGDPPR
jgi:hypothetical protein